MKLLIQPQDGVDPLVAAVKKAKKNVDIVIFRFDRAEIEAALKDAAERGVSVSALIAYANHGGEKSLRKLEMRLLDAGVTVSRTADDLSRYHDKLLIIDRRVLYVLSYNFTHLDIDHSRGFGIVTKKRTLVQEALTLLRADSDRRPYKAGLDDFVVSPVNARKQLVALIGRAKKELFLYDPKIADTEVLSALNERAKKGVDVRIIGSVGRKCPHLKVRPLGGFRLHTRTIIRDGREAFVGSQSLRKAELDSRREVGLIVRDAKVVSGLLKTFEADWGAKETRRDGQDHAAGTQEEPERDGREAVAAQSARQGGRPRGRVQGGKRRPEQDGRERDGRKGREGSRARAGAGNVGGIGGRLNLRNSAPPGRARGSPCCRRGAAFVPAPALAGLRIARQRTANGIARSRPSDISPMALGTGPVPPVVQTHERLVDARQRPRPHLDERQLDMALDVRIRVLEMVEHILRPVGAPVADADCASGPESRAGARSAPASVLRFALSWPSCSFPPPHSIPEVATGVCPLLNTLA